MNKFKKLLEDAYQYCKSIEDVERELSYLFEEILRNTSINLISVKVEYNREQSIYPQALVSYSIDAEGCGFEDLEKIYSKLCDIAQEKNASLNMDEIARKAKFVTIPGSDVMTLRFDIIPEVNIEQESASTVPTEENEDELCRRKIHR